jgi:hypothetical protein
VGDHGLRHGEAKRLGAIAIVADVQHENRFTERARGTIDLSPSGCRDAAAPRAIRFNPQAVAMW